MAEASQLRALEGKYEILEKLSEGGMGSVYKVRHRLLETVRVVKVMRPHLSADELMRARFVREAKLAIGLRHANIAQVFDFTMGDDGAFYLVLEYIDGLDLHRLAKAVGVVPLGVVLEIACQSLDVIGYLHRRDIVHRDISPDNLLVARDDDGGLLVKLIDLGIAKVSQAEENLTAAGTFLGKVRYSAPEQFRTEDGSEVGPRSDLYSFGVVLYELLTGICPIEGENLSALIAGHLMKAPLGFEQTDPEGRVPAPLRAIVLRALAKEPADRFASARAFRSELAALREANPLRPDDLATIFDAPVLMTAKIPVVKPGSTQSRLDRNFAVGDTPAAGQGSGPQATRPPESSAATDDTPPRRRGEADQQVRALLLGAEKLIEAKHADEARLQLETVKALAPDHPGIATLERALDAIDQRLKARIEAAAAEITRSIDGEAFDEAAAKLEKARAELGRRPELDDLEPLLATARTAWQDRQQRIDGILASAREQMAAGEWEDAVPMAREATILDPAHQEAATVLREAEEGLRRYREARRRAAELEKARAAVAAHVEREELDEAERALALSRKVNGDDPVFDGLAEVIAQARAARLQRQVDALCQEGQSLLEGRAFGAAIDRFEKALSLAPQEGRLADLLAAAREGQRLQREAEERQRAIDDTALSVERLMLAGRLESAYRVIDGTEERIGTFDLATSLRARIESDLEQRSAAERAIREQLERVREAAAANEFEAAAKHVATAEKLVADHPELGPAVEEAAREVRDGAEAFRRTQGIELAAGSISARLEAGELRQAERELGLALRLYGDEQILLELRTRLASATRAAKVEQLVAGATAPDTDLDAALSRLEEALQLDPDNEHVASLKAELLATRRRQVEEARARQIADALVPVDALIAEGALEEALAAIESAVAELGDFPEARGLRHRLQRALGK